MRLGTPQPALYGGHRHYALTLPGDASLRLAHLRVVRHVGADLSGKQTVGQVVLSLKGASELTWTSVTWLATNVGVSVDFLLDLVLDWRRFGLRSGQIG